MKFSVQNAERYTIVNGTALDGHTITTKLLTGDQELHQRALKKNNYASKNEIFNSGRAHS